MASATFCKVLGAVAALMGVAGGELLRPTLIPLYGIDIVTAGTLSLLVLLPTKLVACAYFSRYGSFSVLRGNPRMFLAMTLGSILGTIIGAYWPEWSRLRRCCPLGDLRARNQPPAHNNPAISIGAAEQDLRGD